MALRYYTLVHDFCSCRNENNELTPIGERYKEFYDLVKQGYEAVDVLNEMGITKNCCRCRFLCPSVEIMLDRSSGRFIDLTLGNNTINIIGRENKNEVYIRGTPEIKINEEFPILI